MLVLNVPPAKVPAVLATTVVALGPALAGKVRVIVADPPPAARFPRFFGSGDPEADPSEAVVSFTLEAFAFPVLVTVMTS